MLPSIWTDERKAYLDQAWPAGISLGEIMAAINQMPGPPCLRYKQIGDEARRRRVKRPDWYKLQLRREHCTGPKNPRPKKAETPRRNLWTPERLELLTRLWPTTTPNIAILAKLNELAGDKFKSGKQLSAKADYLGLKRPDGFFKRSDLWSDERDSILRTRYEAGSSNEDIIKELNSYPGTPVATRQQLADRASYLGIKRPKDYMARLAEWSRERQVNVRLVDRKPPRMPLPRKLPEPKRKKGSPIKVPYHTLYNQGFQLWYGEAYGRETGDLLPRDKRDDLEAINRAIRKAEPGHPGFEIATRYWGR
jgi:hypothetical protein